MRISPTVRLAFLLLVLGCTEANRVCTLIGCESGVTVHLSSLPSQPFRVEVGAPGADTQYVFDCTNDTARCRREIFFPDLGSDHLFVTVRVGTASRMTEVSQVNYTRFQPNGEHCPGDCRNADVDAAIP